MSALRQALTERILVIDGAMGTLLQSYDFDEAAFRGAGGACEERFGNWHVELRGNNDLLCLTQPHAVRAVHDAYLAAGADIVETNSFNSTAISLRDYEMADLAYELNVAAASIARAAADAASTAHQPRFVAGVLGPTSMTASISPSVEDPAARALTFEELRSAYLEAARGLLDGGSDYLLIETIFDTLNAKAAIAAIEQLRRETASQIDVMVSGTITDKSGRTLSGQTPDALFWSTRHVRPLGFGFNCALGAAELRPHINAVAQIADCYVTVHPNAGLPNDLGGYDESPTDMAQVLGEFARDSLLNIVGGCCGTTPEHIAAIAEAVRGFSPRLPVAPPRSLRLAGLESFVLRDEMNLVNIGERTNVTGSRRFAELIRSGQFDAALAVARDQVEGGAQAIDVNMDDALLDGKAAMERYTRLLTAEPEIARLPLVIDSSDWNVLLAGITNAPGRPLANSISLKEGEGSFLQQAQGLRDLGAAVVVMAFDEEGQAETAERKIAICARAARLLIDEVGYEEADIVFDPAVLAIGTGIDEHARFAIEFIDATRELRSRFPAATISGGISNLSFAFRGNDVVREALHAVFLYHAVQAGLHMGIVNPATLIGIDDLDPDLRELAEDLVFDRRPDATERLVERAAEFASAVPTSPDVEEAEWRGRPVSERLMHALVAGIDSHVESDADEARREIGSALAVIEGPLMAGMFEVGDRFGAGRMFLPQVVKSARVMKRAVGQLTPYLEQETDGGGSVDSRPVIVMATVRGDVHDIGKNIVGVVLQCNNFRVIDLGVMVGIDEMLEAVERENAAMLGVSGLITPSLAEMVSLAAEMERRGLRVPLLIGGATTSKKHTALRIAPAYSGPVVHVPDASRAVGVATSLVGAQRASFIAEVRRGQAALRDEGASSQDRPLVALEAARRRAHALDLDRVAPPPRSLGITTFNDIDLAGLADYIDWAPFLASWDVRVRGARWGDDSGRARAAADLMTDAQRMLDDIILRRALRPAAVAGIFPAHRDCDDVVISLGNGEQQRIGFLRQQADRSADRPLRSLADFISPDPRVADHMGLFAVTAGHGLSDIVDELRGDGDDYGALIAQSLADRLAEALAEWLHERVRRDLWGYASDEQIDNSERIAERYQGIRPAPGYPACPDHAGKRGILEALSAEQIGIELTDGTALVPAASVAGYYFAHPDASYFGVGRVGADQLADYRKRHHRSDSEIEAIERAVRR